jgi:hypothetical protein
MSQSVFTIGGQQADGVCAHGKEGHETQIQQTSETQSDIQPQPHQDIQADQDDYLGNEWTGKQGQG